MFLTALKDGVLRGLRTALMLLRIMIPIYLGVVLLRHTGLFLWIAGIIEPVMRIFGLPGKAVVPLIVGAFSDEYAVVAAMSGLSFGAAQITIIAMIALAFHTLPLETALTIKIGMPALRIALYRLGFAVFTGIVCAYLAAVFLGGDLPAFSAGAGAVADPGTVTAASGTGLPPGGAIFNAGWDVILPEMGLGVLTVVFNLLRVIVPLMIVIELLLAYRLIEAAAKKLTPLCRLFGIGQNALLPLLVGLLLGVTYGAGTIAELNRVKPLSERDMALLGVFLFSCHGIIETTYLFTLAGGNVFFLSAVRLAIAVGITALAARILPQTFRRKL